MIHKSLINPKSIVVIGGSDNLERPGGGVLANLIGHNYKGKLHVVNPKKDTVQGINCVNNVTDLPTVDLAIVAIAAQYVLETVRILATQKNTKAFIIFSAGFSEKDAEGKALENKITQIITENGGTLLGPNNIGLLNNNYAGVFTKPIPKLDSKGIDFISGSGATAVFIIEAAMQMGLPFSSVYSVGNSAQIGVEDILAHLDDTFDTQKSSKIKLLYIESINQPQKLLKHAQSLINKGCKIAAIKAGSTTEGSRAASSHTGALSNSDMAVETLFKKAGIIRCYGRNELIQVAGIFMQTELKGQNIAIVTHAGGPAVMLTDVLSKNGLNIPKTEGAKANALLEQLYEGSSTANPIDFLATGNAAQLNTILNYCENEFDNIDGIAVIFGSPGLSGVSDVYEILNQHIKKGLKPIYPILPSVINVRDDMVAFVKKGHVIFTDEVLFGNALSKVYNSPKPTSHKLNDEHLNINEIKSIISNAKDGYLKPNLVKAILEHSGIMTNKELVVYSKLELLKATNRFEFPLAMKVVGPVHKTDVDGVVLNIQTMIDLFENFQRLMHIPNAEGVLLQPMLKGTELFIGAKKEGDFGHLILCGIGGIFVEILKDIQHNLAPFDDYEALKMIKELKSFKVLEGYRGQKGINVHLFAALVSRVSQLVYAFPEIAELDVNPLIAKGDNIVAVDARIRIKKLAQKDKFTSICSTITT